LFLFIYFHYFHDMVQNSEIQKKLKCFFPYRANDSASDYHRIQQMTSRQMTPSNTGSRTGHNQAQRFIHRDHQDSRPAAAAPAPISGTNSLPVGQRRFPDGWIGPADSKFCKVCWDAGLQVPDYTDHFVKDQPGPAGKVVCPTLLKQACRICGVPGHTSSYCAKSKARREEPRREERYIEREPRRDDRYQREEPRRDDRYQRDEPRRDDRYQRDEPRRDDRYQRNDVSFNSLRDDTERREREIDERDREYYRNQERQSKPWLQAATKKSSQPHEPYAHPHGPRVRLELESPALSAAKHAEPEVTTRPVFIDVRTVQLNHSSSWADEDAAAPFVCDPVKSAQEFLESTFVTDAEFDFMEACDNFGGENCFPDSPRY
jgi:hypothetical protein